jgi:TANFOR domain-containing protein
MFLHSEFTLKVNKFITGLLISLLIFLVPHFGHSQTFPLKVIVVVTPPYSTRISDYVNTPNKINVTIINTSAGPSGKTYNFYLLGSISSDAGVSVSTDPSYIPPRPMQVLPGQVYMLTLQDVEQLYDANHLNYSGTTQHEILADGGFPEGLFTICVRAYDFQTHQPLSDNNPGGCTSFNVRNLEVPIIQKPVCGDTVFDNQNTFIFSWIPPASAPPTIMYRLRIVELLTKEQIPADAFYTAPPNPVFESTSPAPVFVYTSALPPLISGRRYAFAVQAFDTRGKAFFRNNGWSVICNFTYVVKENSIPGGNIVHANVEPKPLSWSSSVSGIIHYKFIDQSETHPLKKTCLTLRVVYVVKNATVYDGKGNKTFINEKVLEPLARDFSNQKTVAEDNGEIRATTMTDDAGNFTLTTTLDTTDKFGLIKSGFSINYGFSFPPDPVKLLGPGDLTLPGSITDWEQGLINVIGLEDGITYGGLIKDGVSDAGYNKTIQRITRTGSLFSGGLINGWSHGVLGELSNLFKSTFSNGSGGGNSHNYQVESLKGSNVNLGGISGDLYRYVRVVVEDQHYNSPDDDFVLKDEQTVHSPDILLSLVNSLKLCVNVKSDAEAGQAAGQNSPMADVRVEAGRLSPIPTDIPVEEGQNLQGKEMMEGSPTTILVSSGITESNPKGFVTLSDLVAVTDKITDPYKLVVSTKKREDIFNYYSDSIMLYPLGTFAEYNSEFTEPVDTVSVILRPQQPRIAGRVMYKNYGVEGAKCVANIETEPAYSDKDGYFEINNLKVVKTDAQLTITKYGYEDNVIEHLGMIQTGGQYWNPDIELVPWGYISGTIQDEDGNPIDAEVRIDSLPFNETQAEYAFVGPGKQKFNFRAPSGNRILHVVPISPDYLAADFNVTLQKNPDGSPPQDLGTFKVSKALHRIRIYVYHMATQNGSPVFQKTPTPDCWVSIDGFMKKNDQTGCADFEFSSPATQFNVKIIPPDSDPHYTPVENMISNNPGKGFQVFSMGLIPGKTVKGVVKLNPGQHGIQGARVYLSGSGSNLNIYTLSDQNGNYSLNGIPEYLQQVSISVDKADPDISYIGETKTADLSKPDATLDLALTRLDGIDLTQIMGFATELTSCQKNQDGSYTVTGHLIPTANGMFMPADPGLTLDFANLKLVRSSRTNAKGIPYAEPADGFVNTDNHSIALKTNSGFKILQLPVTQGSMKQQAKMQITKGADGNGIIKGKTHILKNSFQFPSSLFDYLEDQSFYLYDPFSGSINITTLAGKGTVIPNSKYGLCSSTGNDMALMLSGFSSIASSSASNIKDANISLDLTMTAKLKGGIETIVKTGPIQMSSSVIKNFEVDYPKDISLGGKWSIHAEKLSWTVSQNSFTSKNITLKTGFAPIPVTSMRLLASDIQLDGFKITDLDLANTVPLKVESSAECLFYYDPEVGEAGKPHYVVKIIGQDVTKPIAHVAGKDIHSSSSLDIGSIQVLDDDEQLYSGFENSPPLLFYDVFSLKVNQLTGLQNYFKLTGTYSLGLPGLPDYNRATLNFQKLQNGSQVYINFDPLQFQISGPGNVQFVSSQKSFMDTIYPGNLICKGKISFSDNGVTDSLDVSLHRETSKGYIKVEPETQSFSLGSTSNPIKLNNINGQMSAEATAWDNFWFKGTIVNAPNATQTGETQKFVVSGAITSDGNSISCDNITPLGDVKLTYNLSTKTLDGSLILKDYPLMGFGASGGAEMEFGSSGWYLAGTMKMNSPDPIIIQEITAGLLIANTTNVTPDLQNFILQNAKNKQWPSSIGNKLTGFFFTGYKSLFPPFSVGIHTDIFGYEVGYNVNGEAGVDARYWLNFNSGTKLGFGIMTYGSASVYLGFYTGTICPYVEGGCDILFGIDDGWYDFGQKHIYLDGKAIVGLKFRAGLCFGPTCAGCLEKSISKELDCGVTIETGHDPSFSVSLN